MKFASYPCIAIRLSGMILFIAQTTLYDAQTLFAADVAVVNSSFEDISGESPSNEFTFGPLNGWDLYDPNGVTGGGAGGTYFVGTLTPFEPDPVGNPNVFSFFPDGAADGARVGIAFNFVGSDGQGEYGLTQTLSATLRENTVYDLQVDIGNIGSGTAMSGTFFDLDGFPGYRVDLLAGGQILAQDNNSLDGTIAEGQFGGSSLAFFADANHPQLGQPLEIRLVNLNQLDPQSANSDLEVDFDNVRLNAHSVFDFNFDDLVDAADFTVWRDSLGQTGTNLAADADRNGTVAEADYLLWSDHFGDGNSLPALAVPEPEAIYLIWFALVATLARAWTRNAETTFWRR